MPTNIGLQPRLANKHRSASSFSSNKRKDTDGKKKTSLVGVKLYIKKYIALFAREITNLTPSEDQSQNGAPAGDMCRVYTPGEGTSQVHTI